MTDIVAAALAAVRHADALMRKTADKEDLVLPPDEPHQDWRSRYSGESEPTVYQWHPPYSESFIKYHIYRGGGGRNPIVWGANHHGINQGMETIQSPSGGYGNITWPLYSNGYEPNQLGRFKTPEKAKAAAEAHYAENYPRASHDYDIDAIMDDNPQAPAGGKRGLGDDEDYSRIFDAVRRALKKAGLALRRTAGTGSSSYPGPGFREKVHGYWDWYQDQYPGGTSPEALHSFSHWYQKHIQPDVDLNHVHAQARDRVFQTTTPEQRSWANSDWRHRFSPEDDGTFEDWMDKVGDPNNQKSRGGIGTLGKDGYDNPWEGDNGTYTPLPISQPPGHNGEGFDPDEHQDPFDPRLLGASRLDPADIYRLAGDGLSYEDTMKYINEQFAQGESTDNNWFQHYDNSSNLSSLPPGHKWVQFKDEMDEDDDPNDPRPRYFQGVPEVTPEGGEQWHVRGAEGGWRYHPDELVFHDKLPEGLQRGEYGIWSPIKHTGHEGFDPDENPSPFDPRL